jgi:hypothetical protein
MKQLFSSAGLRRLSLMLSVVLLLASAAQVAGVVVVFGPSQPEFTVNICQPIQAFDRVSNTLLARPTMGLAEFGIFDLGSVAEKQAVRLVDCRIAPDTPPPRRSV